MVKEKSKSCSQSLKIEQKSHELVLHNDEVNTFDFVIETLIEVCGHEPMQAEQCTLIVHHKGKCAVKKGAFEALKPLQQEIINRGLNATIN